MRIAIAGLSHETNTFSSLFTRREDFLVRRGDEVLDEPGFRDLLVRLGVEPVPILFARALPSGPVEAATYRAFKEEILTGLTAAGSLDGLFLLLHGAMYVDGVGDAETDLVRAIRAQVGDDLPIAARLDLHGNMTPEFVDRMDVLVAYRTAPHRDVEETRDRALSLLTTSIRAGCRPCTVMVRVPLLLFGEQAITEVEPMRSLMAMLPQVEAQPGVLAASILVGFAWADVPDAAASVLVVAEDRDHREEALAQARRLARAMWERRTQFGYDVEALPGDEAIEAALTAPEPTVFISDSGDNTTAGGAGDVPYLLERLLARGVPDAVFAALTDAPATRRCYMAGVGAEVSLTVGGRLDPVHGRPLPIAGRVIHLAPSEEGIATIQVDGVRVILTRRRLAFTRLADFQRAGIDPLAHKIVVVKLGYLFPELRDVAPRAIMALTPGFATQDITALPYRRVARPIYPLDPDMEMAW